MKDEHLFNILPFGIERRNLRNLYIFSEKIYQIVSLIYKKSLLGVYNFNNEFFHLGNIVYYSDNGIIDVFSEKTLNYKFNEIINKEPFPSYSYHETITNVSKDLKKELLKYNYVRHSMYDLWKVYIKLPRNCYNYFKNNNIPFSYISKIKFNFKYKLTKFNGIIDLNDSIFVKFVTNTCNCGAFIGRYNTDLLCEILIICKQVYNIEDELKNNIEENNIKENNIKENNIKEKITLKKITLKRK